MTTTMKTLACAMALIGAVALDAVAQSAVVASKGTSTPVAVTAPSTTTPTNTSTSTSAKEESPAVGQLQVTRLVVGTDVSEREPVGVASSFTTAETKRLLAFIEVQNAKAEASSLEVAWIDTTSGKERSHQVLAVGASKRWRTWARSGAPKKAGEYAVVVRDGDGIELARTSFAMTE
jgi:hypothetical protein